MISNKVACSRFSCNLSHITNISWKFEEIYQNYNLKKKDQTQATVTPLAEFFHKHHKAITSFTRKLVKMVLFLNTCSETRLLELKK